MNLKPLDLMVDSFAPLHAGDLQQLEADFGISLPKTYREFLLRQNGGRFVDRVEVASSIAGPESPGIWCIYSVGSEDDRFDIRKRGRHSLSGCEYPSGWIAVASGNDSEILMSVSQGPNFGSVTNFTRGNGQTELAGDFGEFIESLCLIAKEQDEDEDSIDPPAFEAAGAFPGDTSSGEVICSPQIPDDRGKPSRGRVSV